MNLTKGKITNISLSDHEGILVVRIHSFLTAALEEGECSSSRPGRLAPGKEAGRLQLEFDGTR